MKHLKVLGWASMFFLLLFTACRKEDINIVDKPIIPDPVVMVESSLKGQVIDENDLPVEGVTIKLNDVELLTDENGIFFVRNTNMNENGTLVTARKTGYFNGTKVFNPSLGTESYLLIQLLAKDGIGNFSSSDGGSVTTVDDTEISFSANSIMYDDGTEYNGEVKVYGKWIDPTHPQWSIRMPGDLRAIDADQNRVQLATYGMVAVELETPSGVALQIRKGMSATISMPVPSEILDQAPSSIPLWSMDEETGYWVEESTAILQDGKYVGEVPHFSFWNCDAPFDVISLSGTILDLNENSADWVYLEIFADGIGTRSGYTNSEGKFQGKVPKDLPLTLKVFDLCLTEIYSQDIGALSVDTDLGEITIDQLEPLTVNGALVKCDGTAVTSGYALMEGAGGSHFATVDENTGDFSTSYYLCEDTDITMKGYDLDIPLTSEAVTMTATVGGTVDFGTVEVCDEITEIITIEIPSLGYVKSFFIYTASIGQDDVLRISLEGIQDSIFFDLNIYDSTATGTTPVDYLHYSDYINASTANKSFYCETETTCPDIEIATNEGSGGVFEGEIMGNLTDEGSNEEYEFIISIKVILQE